MANPIPSEQLTENTYVVVDGYINYSHVTSFIDGELLAKRNEGRLYPIRDPYTSIALRDSRIRPASGDPANLSLEEQFVQNTFYDSKKDPSKVNIYSIDNKGNRLPAIYEPKDPNDLAQGYEQVVEPAGELDRDLSATLVLQVYKPQGLEKRGIGLRLININEKIRYYSGGLDMNHLQNLGIVLNNAPAPTMAPASAPATNVGAPNNQNYTDYSSGQGLPTPGVGGSQPNHQPPAYSQQNQQGYQPQAPAPQQQNYQQAPAPQQHQPQQHNYQQQPQPGYQQATAQQPIPQPAQHGQSAFDTDAAPMNQQVPSHNSDNQSPWPTPQSGPGMYYQP